LFKTTQFLYKFHNNVINQGQYVIPFSFMLPSHVPGSFEYYDNENIAYIKYILQLRALSSGKSEHITNSILLIVRQPPNFFQYPTKLSDTQTIRTWCCFNKGVSTLNVSYEKNYYCPDENVKMVCELNNSNCNLNGSSIILSLFQVITLKDKKNRTKILPRKVCESRYDGVYLAGQESFKPLELIISDLYNPCISHVNKCGHNFLFQDKNMISKLQATVKSNFVDCKYHFQVSTEYDSVLCCNSKPNIDIPIIIYIPDLRYNNQLYQPKNWNPQILEKKKEIDLPTFNDINQMNVNVNVNYNNNNMNINVQGQSFKNDNNQGFQSNNQIAGGMANQGFQSNNQISNQNQGFQNDNQNMAISSQAQPYQNDFKKI